MKKSSYDSNPVATMFALLTLSIIGLSAKHCMKKYTRGGKKMTL